MYLFEPITIADALATKEFQEAELVAGKRGLANSVRWIHPLDIWDTPEKWINGGELIFCSGAGVKNVEDLVPFFQSALRASISGFVLLLNKKNDYIPQEMVDLADEHDCPLIVFRTTARYIDLAQSVLGASIRHINTRNSKEMKIIRANSWVLSLFEGDGIRKDLNIPDSAIDEAEEGGYVDSHVSAPKLHEMPSFVIDVELSASAARFQDPVDLYCPISRQLRYLLGEYQFKAFPFFIEQRLACLVFDYGETQTWKARLSDVCEKVNTDGSARAFVQDDQAIIITAGKRSASLSSVPESYRCAKEAMVLCLEFKSRQLFYEDIGAPLLLGLLAENGQLDRTIDFVKEQLGPLYEYDKEFNGRLFSTLRIYYKNNGNKQLTSSELYITRQSLYYRLRQLEEIIGVDLLDPGKRLALETSISFFDLILNTDYGRQRLMR